ncbi:retinol dehydrogenase 7-like [Haemaphysalis longicornis]
MRTSWTLFVIFALLFWDLWDRVPLLTTIGSFVGSATIILFASHWLSRFVWKKAFVRQLSSEGKAVVVIGCDTGFGHALASRLHRDGFLVFAGCLDSQSSGAKELQKLSNVRVLQLDITKEEQVDEAFQTVQQQLGSRVLWSVVANAGIRNNGLVEWLTMDSIMKVFDVNVFGTLRVTKKFLPLLKVSKGRMVIVTSPFGHISVPMAVPYCMTKHALVCLVDGLRRECQGKGVEFVSIEPIAYRTPITCYDGLYEQAQQELQQQSPEVIDDYSSQEIKRWTQATHVIYDVVARDNLEEVVEPIVQAIRETYPKTTYCSPFRLGAFLFYVPRIVPTELTDVLMQANLKLVPFLSRSPRNAQRKTQ